MADLESSLTAMDWLPRLTVGGAMAGAVGKDGVSNGQLTKTQGGNIALRKAPNSPLDTNATLDQNDATSHRDGKPPYSYANLITFAINSSQKKKMTLSEIYQWICDHFPYYKDAGNGWKVLITVIKIKMSTNQIMAMEHLYFNDWDSIISLYDNS